MTNSPNETTSPSASACETGALTFDAIARNARDFAADRSNVVAKNAVTSNGVRASARVPERVARNTTVFDVEVKQGDRTDQQRSGRCWMFASLNTMRIRTIKKFNLKTFEFSQAYPLYWDKLEKANWFFENILDTLDEPRDGRLVSFLLADPVGDGGQWDMFRALVKKYGVVPKEAMPDTACAKNTYEMDAYLTRYLRKCACELRSAHEGSASVDELRSAKERMLANVQRMLTICLGEPPKTFDVRLRDTDDKLALSGTFTPREFFERTVGMELDDYVSVISAPTADKPFGHTYTVERLGNVVEAGGVRYLNLPVDRLKEMAAAQLKDGLPVWFGCDVDQSFLQKDGVMDRDAVDVDALFGFEIDRGFDKAQRLDFGESAMTHAMTLEG